jgi:cell division septum initiation protein DivIVA
MTRLTDLEIEQLKADKKLIVNYLKAVQRIHNLLETNKQQKKGIDRLRRKVEYYRQTTNNLMNLIQKSDNYDILYKEIPKDYDGPKEFPLKAELEMVKRERDALKSKLLYRSAISALTNNIRNGVEAPRQ